MKILSKMVKSSYKQNVNPTQKILDFIHDGYISLLYIIAFNNNVTVHELLNNKSTLTKINLATTILNLAQDQTAYTFAKFWLNGGAHSNRPERMPERKSG